MTISLPKTTEPNATKDPFIIILNINFKSN
ncbi:hypothetical protein N824_26630 [Pedobacter sp. V48]|nr:hypothetical protein N824_26630 [Pedobacter sp. V48]